MIGKGGGAETEIVEVVVDVLEAGQEVETEIEKKTETLTGSKTSALNFSVF